MSKIQVEVLESKIGVPALQVEIDDKKMMLHSKYNPVQEAEHFIDSLREKIEEADHVLFYGIGLGYHVKYFSAAYPEKLISAYEPIEQIATISLRELAVTEFPKDKLSHYIVEDSQHPLVQNMEFLGELIHQKMLLIVLPVYERLFSEQTKEFGKALKSFLMTKGSNIVAAALFSKRWTLNALMNLPETFKHENIILHKKKFFKNKPVILVSAGPSLDEELEKLRIIKEKGLAYIFAVGSAAKALMLTNIYPDAICTYDPQQHNHYVFKEIYEQRITDIPMIYGTSVGFETLQFYQGPKFYFVTSQDQITPQFHKEQIPVISDAPTIALIMLQIFHALEVKQVYLVGQNLAFKEKRYYSKEVKRYDYEKKELTNSSIQTQDLINSFEVEDVHGGKVITNDSLNRMRLDIENYIDFVNMPVINTTNGGAAIKGANYQSLQQIIEEKLTEKIVVDEWWKSLIPEKSNEINQSFKKKYSNEFNLFVQRDKELENYLEDFQNSLLSIKSNQMRNKLDQLEKLFLKYQKNVFFQTTISPIAQLVFEKLNVEIRSMNRMEISRKKVEKAIQVYNNYLTSCRAFYRNIAPIITKHIMSELAELSEIKGYSSTSGVFHYIGDWEKKYHIIKENENFNSHVYAIGVETKEKGAQIAFRFHGTFLKLFGTVHSQDDLQLQVTVDGKVNIIKIKNPIDDKYGSFMKQKVFEISGLEEELHDVEITVLSDNPSLVFEGAEIDIKGRAYHIDEVISVDELEIGKRIRCHYKASYNKVGEFTTLGEESGDFLSLNACSDPDGDFYFIMVDNIEGIRKLIADRIIQNRIDKYAIQDKKVYINKKRGIVTCLSNNEWDKYLVFNVQIVNASLAWNSDSISTSWVNDSEFSEEGYSIVRGSHWDEWSFKKYGRGFEYSGISLSSKMLNLNGYRPQLILNEETYG
ncbi:6-hydroxymethylpterin diphosphokinase MptE-like protein [Lysinibacillus sp. NPDC048646]|uniref:6-hydroxymethylpterin diphosphokinase MptE-like protein n=1 Tax=Lysinibacillus sp. NPDC048646 TaxID=3390574 RepID=UPI003D050A39